MLCLIIPAYGTTTSKSLKFVSRNHRQRNATLTSRPGRQTHRQRNATLTSESCRSTSATSGRHSTSNRLSGEAPSAVQLEAVPNYRKLAATMSRIHDRPGGAPGAPGGGTPQGMPWLGPARAAACGGAAAAALGGGGGGAWGAAGIRRRAGGSLAAAALAAAARRAAPSRGSGPGLSRLAAAAAGRAAAARGGGEGAAAAF